VLKPIWLRKVCLYVCACARARMRVWRLWWQCVCEGVWVCGVGWGGFVGVGVGVGGCEWKAMLRLEMELCCCMLLLLHLIRTERDGERRGEWRGGGRGGGLGTSTKKKYFY